MELILNQHMLKQNTYVLHDYLIATGHNKNQREKKKRKNSRTMQN